MPHVYCVEITHAQSTVHPLDKNATCTIYTLHILIVNNLTNASNATTYKLYATNGIFLQNTRCGVTDIQIQSFCYISTCGLTVGWAGWIVFGLVSWRMRQWIFTSILHSQYSTK